MENRKKKYKIFYIVSMLILIVLSIYPIYMGLSTFMMYCSQGMIMVEEYRKYIIPYTPMCTAIIVAAALLPVFYKMAARWSLLIDSAVGVVLFFIVEVCLEQIKVVEGYTTLPLEAWQFSLCSATPEVLEAIGEPIYAELNPAYKVHFYLIAIVIIVCVIGILHGFTEMILKNRSEKKRPLIVQTICVAVFVGLCILACFTAFYRNGTLYISPLSSFLTGLFFVVFGTTFGVYCASHLYKKSRLLSVFLPVVIAMMTTVVMYLGELVLMGGALFRFGTGIFFEPLGYLPLSWCDFGIILLSGLITGILSYLLNREGEKKGEQA